MRGKGLIVAVCICCLYFSPRNIFSDNIKKADKYYAKYDYLHAIQIYEKIYAKNPSLDIAQKIAHCYRLINDSRKAETAYARVLTYKDFRPDNYKYYGDALKENGKYDEAKASYLMYAEKDYSRAIDAVKLANSCDVARMWASNPSPGVDLKAEPVYNSVSTDQAMVKYGAEMAFVSDRWFNTDAKSGVSNFTGNPYFKLYQTNSSGVPSLMPEPLNGDFEVTAAVFSADGSEVYLSRTEGSQSAIKALYHSRKSNNKWSVPTLVFPKASYSIQDPALSADGKTLYFASDMQGGIGGMDIYRSKQNPDGSWAKPENCGRTINTIEDEVAPVIGPDNTLYFASAGHIGMGGLDIFRAKINGNYFSDTENLRAPVNTSKDDYGILFLTDKTGYFASNRDGGQGMSDIYAFTFNDVPVSAQPVFAVAGEVIDKQTGAPLAGMDIFLVNKESGEQNKTLSDAQGRFRFDLQAGQDYIIKGNSQRYYLAQEGGISTRNVTESTVFNVRFELERSEEAYIVTLKNIYYDFDRWNIRADARPELERVLNFMRSMPDVAVEMRAHTDARGTAAYNLQLSQKRARSASDYLMRGGISALRLSAKGLGESELLNRCADNATCSDEQHQLNRRTEFKVVRVKTNDVAKAGAKTRVLGK